ncbi:MAG: triacylglycerol lipase [Firmicutes bacterium]|nr:triacylglycerol lipase [Bacillota bacterium]
MQYLKRLAFYPLVLLFLHSILAYHLTQGFSAPLRILALALAAAGYLYYNISPAAKQPKASSRSQSILIGGCELIAASGFFLAAQIVLYACIGFSRLEVKTSVLAANAVFSAVFIVVLLFSGMIRVAATSKQLGAVPRIAMFLVWWVPIVNIAVLWNVWKTARDEYRFLRGKRLLNEGRRADEICKTRYPLLMVHGVFFRDWKHFNYWGRIPKELIANGAQVFYGNHNSALAVEQSGEELKARILEITRGTGCEKVHIIAHSKGGLDARYAVSRLGMDAHVASLTTVNTPHRGTPLAEKLLSLAPDKLAAAVGRQYGKIFAKLGDDECDFLGSVNGLTPEVCGKLNEIMPDKEGVLYQSVGSMMRAASGAGPPLNAGYAIIKPMGGDNDGLVCTDSMAWGECLGILRPQGKRGISHGDMIDLTRKNVPGFDVCEFYVRLAADLKEKGL